MNTKSLRQRLRFGVSAKAMREEAALVIEKYEADIGMLLAELADLKVEINAEKLAASYVDCDNHVLKAELATLRPAAEALKTAVELGLEFYQTNDNEVWVGYEGKNSRIHYKQESHNGDPLAATIRAINRAAEAVKENGK